VAHDGSRAASPVDLAAEGRPLVMGGVRGGEGAGRVSRRPLGRRFYARSTADLARALLGNWLCREIDGAVRRGRIVEVEAYTDDAASHARGRRRTPRNAVMFGRAGHAYVYFTYGMHHCVNVVAERHGEPGAVLIRALDHLPGANGPGRLCRALAIDRALNGVDLAAGEQLWIERGRRREPIVQTTRIGIRQAAELPWRYYLLGSPGVSRRDPAAERRVTRP
jgi:DNA-3-methyladenine glycosylase